MAERQKREAQHEQSEVGVDDCQKLCFRLLYGVHLLIIYINSKTMIPK